LEIVNDFEKTYWQGACTVSWAEREEKRVKRIDYYASQSPWKMPKWVGAMLGGIFGVIAIGSGFLILQLTRAKTPVPLAAVGAVGSLGTSAAAPAAAPKSPTVAAPAAAVATATPAPMAEAEVADGRHHSRHHSHHGSKETNLAKKSSPAAAPASPDRTNIVAKHDTKEKRHEKDELDKLLGL
jgi:hypothetical protein